MEDSSMVLQNNSDANKLYQMDIETGKVIEEWKVHDDIPIINYVPDSVSKPNLCSHINVYLLDALEILPNEFRTNLYRSLQERTISY